MLYLNNKKVGAATLGELSVENIYYNPISDVSTNGLLAWLNPETYTSGSSQWLSYTGSIAATASLNGASSLPYWDATTFTFTDTQTMNLEPYQSFNLDPTNGADYTIIVFGRFNGVEGAKHGRLLTSGHYGQVVTSQLTNWTLGTEGTNTEAFYTYGTVGSVGYIYGPSGAYDTNWRMYTGICDRLFPSSNTNFKFYSNKELKANTTYSNASGNTGPYSVGINTGSYAGGTAGGQENNNCVVGDILIYNRVLVEAEIINIYGKLGPKYGLM
jgi:hypothetical protein